MCCVNLFRRHWEARHGDFYTGQRGISEGGDVETYRPAILLSLLATPWEGAHLAAQYSRFEVDKDGIHLCLLRSVGIPRYCLMSDQLALRGRPL